MSAEAWVLVAWIAAPVVWVALLKFAHRNDCRHEWEDSRPGTVGTTGWGIVTCRRCGYWDLT